MAGAAALCAALTAFGAAPASAAPLTYDFSATVTAGPLAGDVFPGVFTVDSSAVAAGSGNVTLDSFTVLGTTVTGSEGVFGLVPSATFASNGSLTSLANFVVISTARGNADGLSGGIFLPSPITSFNFDGNFNYGIDPNQGENIGGGTFAGNVVAGVPEPGSLLSLGAGLAMLGLGLGRRRARINGSVPGAAALASHSV